jgi:hypothetical protein
MNPVSGCCKRNTRGFSAGASYQLPQHPYSKRSANPCQSASPFCAALDSTGLVGICTQRTTSAGSTPTSSRSRSPTRSAQQHLRDVIAICASGHKRQHEQCLPPGEYDGFADIVSALRADVIAIPDQSALIHGDGTRSGSTSRATTATAGCSQVPSRSTRSATATRTGSRRRSTRGTRTCLSSARGSCPSRSTADATRLRAGPPRSAAPLACVSSSTGRSASSGRRPGRLGLRSARCCAWPRRRCAR